jgi:hypothetical protein
MWSTIYRDYSLMVKINNTNTLAEAWHAMLKIRFFKAKRNQRVDRLLWMLTTRVSQIKYKVRLEPCYSISRVTCVQLILYFYCRCTNIIFISS